MGVHRGEGRRGQTALQVAPRRWGSTVVVFQMVDRIQGCPTPVGVHHETKGGVTMPQRLPQASGGSPASMTVDQHFRLVAPRRWGFTIEQGGLIPVQLGCPTPVGVYRGRVRTLPKRKWVAPRRWGFTAPRDLPDGISHGYPTPVGVHRSNSQRRRRSIQLPHAPVGVHRMSF